MSKEKTDWQENIKIIEMSITRLKFLLELRKRHISGRYSQEIHKCIADIENNTLKLGIQVIIEDKQNI